jgi:hypothetical protein
MEKNDSISFKGNGKLLLTGEYFVLDGVPALAVPTKQGQAFTVRPSPTDTPFDLHWRAYDIGGNLWLQEAFNQADWARPQVRGEDARARICQLLASGEKLHPGCTAGIRGLEVTTRLTFDRKWGLGTSSTLVAAVARWLEVNPYELLELTFGGSGYDLACAIARGPILYERNGSQPRVTPLDWHPEWVKNTHFVYRNQKQNSREGILAYRTAPIADGVKAEIGDLTRALLDPSLHPRAAAQILHRHEQVVSETLEIPTVQEELFPDFPGQLKSLGAWGGDFIWAVSEESGEKVREYFNGRGFETVIEYEKMIL